MRWPGQVLASTCTNNCCVHDQTRHPVAQTPVDVHTHVFCHTCTYQCTHMPLIVLLSTIMRAQNTPLTYAYTRTEIFMRTAVHRAWAASIMCNSAEPKVGAHSVLLGTNSLRFCINLCSLCLSHFKVTLCVCVLFFLFYLLCKVVLTLLCWSNMCVILAKSCLQERKNNCKVASVMTVTC